MSGSGHIPTNTMARTKQSLMVQFIGTVLFIIHCFDQHAQYIMRRDFV